MFKVRMSRIAAVVVALTLGALCSAQAANADTGPLEIHSQRNGLCLDADNSTGNHDGIKVQLWGCSGGQNQKWILESGGRIRNVWSGRCLDADDSTGKHDGIKVQLWSCGSGTNQLWRRSVDFYGELLNVWANRVLDANIDGPNVDQNGMQVQLWSAGSSGPTNQIWNLV